jgi:signal-transduction protein with cAMP-binding, CBS, and nucleotidyltransferase domain/PAS domain-containing protein
MNKIIRRGIKRIFILKIDLPAILAISLFAGLIFFYLIPGFEKVMMDRKRIMIHEMTSAAYSLLNYYHSLEEKGILESEEAKSQARSAVSTIRYGETLKDYFWITDTFPRMIIHPYRPELNGTDLTDFRDSKGKAIFVEFVRVVSAAGESYVDYMWQWNDDSTRIVPKLSNVRLFEPWGWIIGTGIYIDDVRSEIRRIVIRALFISGIIGLVIIILLIAISRQSHKIEDERKRAEDELRKSKELYRTLAEAASEGVLIWSVQGLQANKTLLSWLGFTESELGDVTFKSIFSSTEMPDINDSETLFEDLSARRYVECVLRMKNGNLLKSHADFSRIILGELKAVLVVIRPVKSLSPHTGFSTSIDLLDDIKTGFFRLTYGRKNRFLFASKPTIEMLGYNNFQELLTHAIESFFVNQFQLKAFRSDLASGENIYGRKVLLRRKGGDEFLALISIVMVESDSKEIWCEGTIEPLAAYASENNFPVVDLNDYSSSFIMEAPVLEIMRSIVECRENLSVLQAVSLMKENNSQFLAVTNKNGEPMGIIDAVMVGIRLAEGGSSQTEVFRWMSSPPDFIQHDATINDAYRIMQSSLRKCLLVTTADNMVAGMITYTELSQAFFTAPRLIISEIEKAGTSSVLRKTFENSHKLAISMILGNADPYAVSLFLSDIADSICRRVLKLCIEDAGEPPCRFAFIQTGSAGRREQTFSTDQDNAIIYENWEGENLAIINKYFLSLGKKVNDMLADSGFRLCKGGNMAGNQKWCQPLSTWKKYFSDWIKVPGPDELLEVSIFFDFRFCYGDTGLADELREYILKDLKTNDIYFHHLTSAWKQFNPSLSQLTEEKIDIKKILMPLTGIIRLYSLKYGISGFSTIERILELHSGRYLDYQLLSDSMSAWRDLTSIRLSHQASNITNKIEPDNIIDLHITGNDKRCLAGQAINVINNLMLKAGNEFYTEII